MVKLTNDQNIKNLKKRKILKRFIILFGILTIVLAVLSLTVKLGFGYSLVAFIIMTILTRQREKISVNLNKDLETKRIEKAIEKQKKKQKRK